jgi:hypothetical protein
MYYLSRDEHMFFLALCETIVPEGADPNSDPGALTVGAIDYIDSSLVDSSKDRQEYFHQAIRELDKVCQARFSDKFCNLKPEQRDHALKDFYLDPKTKEKLFDLRSLVLEGFYSDYHSPAYKGITAWTYVGFGGKGISGIKKDWNFLRIWRDTSKSDSDIAQ